MKFGTGMFVTKTSRFNIVNYNYLLIDNVTGEMILIDPSWEHQKIKQAVENISGHVKAILLTHSHIDHINLAGQFAEEFHADVFMGKKEIADYAFTCKNLKALEDGEVIRFGESEVRGIHTPGHTSGSMCFQTDGMLFTGDTVFIEGCGICTSPGGSAEDMYNSIQKIKSITQEECRIYPAHSYGKPIGSTMGSVKKNNIYFNITEKRYFVEFRMRSHQRGLFDFK